MSQASTQDIMDCPVCKKPMRKPPKNWPEPGKRGHWGCLHCGVVFQVASRDPDPLRAKAIAELERCCTIIKEGKEAVPRFAVECPEGDFVVFCPLPDDDAERLKRMQIVKRLLACKMATAFVFSGEMKEPDVVTAVAVTQDRVFAHFKVITRAPLGFVADGTLKGRDEIGDGLPDMLPTGTSEISAGEMAELERVVREWHPGSFA